MRSQLLVKYEEEKSNIKDTYENEKIVLEFDLVEEYETKFKDLNIELTESEDDRCNVKINSQVYTAKLTEEQQC